MADILDGHYKNVKTIITEVTGLCGLKIVKSINPKSNTCMERYPCSGHAGVVITFENGEVLEYPCTSVAIGAIMYYYKIDNNHFSIYVNEKCKRVIDQLRV